MDKRFEVSVLTKEQFLSILEFNISCIDRIYIDCSAALEAEDLINSCKDHSIYLAMPYILRQKDMRIVEDILRKVHFEGVLVRNLESFSFLNSIHEKLPDLKVVLSENMYILNHEAFSFYKENSLYDITGYCRSYELTSKEALYVDEAVKTDLSYDVCQIVSVYGHIPMMQTSNCLKKTLKRCNGTKSFFEMQDRVGKSFMVFCNCDFCYNTIYNSVPLSLHRFYGELDTLFNLKLDFTVEDAGMMKSVVDYYTSIGKSVDIPPYKDFTTGHFKHPVL